MPSPAQSPPRRIVLVGFMGCGKTTVGRLLAHRLGWEFRDLDTWIEERLGISVPQVFAQHGEGFFRESERQVAALAGGLDRHVIAAGGGAFAVEETRELLRSGAATVWLRCDWEVLLGRIPDDGSRPLAANRERMRNLYSEREGCYRLADHTIDTTARTPDEVVSRIMTVVGTDAADEGQGAENG